MKTKLFFLAAMATFALTSCVNDEFIGDNDATLAAEAVGDGSIQFGNGFRAITRVENKYDKAAADLLGAKFIVTGVKGDGTWTANQTDVFKSYSVMWAQNTAGTTESNTSDWEYVGKDNDFGLSAQTIKFWDYSATDYNFAAYSIGTGSATGSAITINVEATANSSAYTLTGTRANLTKCYITDMKTVAHNDFQDEVVLEFRSLASKVRMALYETVPGYSIKDVRFRTADVAAPSTSNVLTYETNTDATLFGSAAFRENGTFTVSFPVIGSDQSSNSNHNKAHVGFTPGASPTSDTQGFGELNYTTTLEGYEDPGSYLQRSSKTPSFAGEGTYYQVMLPNEEGVVLEMCVDYTLLATDGSGEQIKVYGAKAFVPAVYTKWKPNYAYTYIFKISDNTNGWTNPADTDPAGLFPITFDAVVLDDELTGTQTTITSVAKPSITTYQKGHVYSASDEYKLPAAADATDAASNDAIYAQVMNDGTLVTDLNASPTPKSFFYKLSDSKTEAEVMDALNIRESESAGTITGRNGLVLTPATADYTVTQIPGEDGNWVTTYWNGSATVSIAAGMVAKLTPATAGTYAFVYQTTTGSPSPVITTLILATAPPDWVTGAGNVYYSDAACENKITTAFTTAIHLDDEPSDWNATNNVYYSDAACTTQVNSAFSAGDYYKKVTCYKKYTDLNNTYAVKVIKVE